MGSNWAGLSEGRRRRRRYVFGVLAAGMVVAPLAASTGAGAAVATYRVSVATGGRQVSGENAFRPPSLSADGRFVAYHSLASSLVTGDTNEVSDVFLHDRQSVTTTRVSVSSTGTEGNDQSSFAEISADGRFVAFLSGASNLVPGDTNGAPVSPTAPPTSVGRDAFVRSLATGTTTRVSVSTGGGQGDCPAVAPDADPPNRRPCGGGATGADTPAISGDGTFVAFTANATNLVTPCTPTAPALTCDTNGASDIFVHDRRGSGTTTRVSLCTALPDPGGLAPPSPPPSTAPGCVPATRQSTGASTEPSISVDGNVVAFRSVANNLVAGDTNGQPDIFVHDRRGISATGIPGTTTRVNLTTTGEQATGGASNTPEISDDGCYVAFRSAAANLVAGDSNNAEDIFVRGPICPGAGPATTVRVSVPTGGGQALQQGCPPAATPTTPCAEANSFNPSLSSDGRYVAFESSAKNLVADDTNNASDTFIHDRLTGTTLRGSVANGGAQAQGGSFFSALSGDGRIVGFSSDATNLVGGDTNRAPDIFAVDRLATQAAPDPTGGVNPAPSGATGGGSGAGAGASAALPSAAAAAAPAATTGVSSGARARTVGSSGRRGLPVTGMSSLLMAAGGALLAAGTVLYAGTRRKQRRRMATG